MHMAEPGPTDAGVASLVTWFTLGARRWPCKISPAARLWWNEGIGRLCVTKRSNAGKKEKQGNQSVYVHILVPRMQVTNQLHLFLRNLAHAGLVGRYRPGQIRAANRLLHHHNGNTHSTHNILGRVWKRGCGQPGPASRPWLDLGRLKRATHSCLGYWPNPAWSRRAGVWAPPRSRAGSPTATNR
jgi:hypothetical protein